MLRFSIILSSNKLLKKQCFLLSLISLQLYQLDEYFAKKPPKYQWLGKKYTKREGNTTKDTCSRLQHIFILTTSKLRTFTLLKIFYLDHRCNLYSRKNIITCDLLYISLSIYVQNINSQYLRKWLLKILIINIMRWQT